MNATVKVIAAAVIAAMVTTAAALAQGSPVLDQMIGPNHYGQPVIVQLPRAIGSGEFAIRLAEATGVPIVFEAAREEPQARSTQSVTLTGMPLRDALELLSPDYLWRDHDGVMIIRSRTEWVDPHDPLNQPAPAIDWTNVNAQHVLEFIAHVIYHEPARQPTFQPSGEDRRFALRVDGSVLDVLVASAGADGAVVWTVPWPTPDGNPCHFEVSVRGLVSIGGLEFVRGIAFVRPMLPPSLQPSSGC
jgi:hypothetical protein